MTPPNNEEICTDIPLNEPKAAKTKTHTAGRGSDQVQIQLQELIGTMRENVALAATRGESLQSIQAKSRILRLPFTHRL